MYELSPRLKYRILEKSIEILVPNQGLVTISNLDSRDINIFESLVKKNSKQIENSKIIKKLKKLNFLISRIDKENDLENRNIAWYNYYSKDPLKVLDVFSKIKICILGCGGLGSVIFNQLLQAGFRNLIIVDNSVIDQPDLNRQLIFKKSDINSFKVDVLEKYAITEYDNLSIKTYKDYIDSPAILNKIIDSEQPEFIFNCIDTPGNIKQIVMTSILQTDSIILFGSVGLTDGTIGPLLDNPEDKINYLKKIKNEDYSKVLLGSISMTNSIIASKMALECVFYYLNLPVKSYNKEIVLDFEN